MFYSILLFYSIRFNSILFYAVLFCYVLFNFEFYSIPFYSVLFVYRSMDLLMSLSIRLSIYLPLCLSIYWLCPSGLVAYLPMESGNLRDWSQATVRGTARFRPCSREPSRSELLRELFVKKISTVKCKSIMSRGHWFNGLLQAVDVSDNNGTPKSSILIGFSIINHPFWGTPIFGNTTVLFFRSNCWFRQKNASSYEAFALQISQMKASSGQRKPLCFRGGAPSRIACVLLLLPRTFSILAFYLVIIEDLWNQPVVLYFSTFRCTCHYMDN